MKIPYTKAQMIEAASGLPKKSAAVPNENLAVLSFYSTAKSVAHARKNALAFVENLLLLTVGADAVLDGLAEDILAEAGYIREYLDEPGRVKVTYRLYNTFIRYTKNTPAVELQLDRQLAGV